LSNKIKITSRLLRKRATPAEVILWEEIRNRKLNGLKFRRQYPVSGFILDFYCAEKNLGIELDGSIHNTQEEYDKLREQRIIEKGIRVLRFSNQEILENLEDVKTKIENLITLIY
jgi:very-short-patch-repair endonuclease